ncbi:MAG: hypothetical protein ACREPD_18650 [Stenotrophomonas sp.]|uniref:hypothetical protein n=1 Tax=Stenotrophomonas sp. TaxID=69392 RepID=UPI003D6D5DAF
MGIDHSTPKVHAVYIPPAESPSPSLPSRVGPSRRRHAVPAADVWQPWNGQELRRDVAPNYIGNTLLRANLVSVPRSGHLPDFPWKPVLVDLTTSADTRSIGTQTDLVLGAAEPGPFPAVSPEQLALSLLQKNRALQNVVGRPRYRWYPELPYAAAARPRRAVRPMATSTASADRAAALPQQPLNLTQPAVAPQAAAPVQGMTPLFQLEAMYPALSPQLARYYPERWF